MIGAEALTAAQELIDWLQKERGLDYSAHKEVIARDIFWDGLLEGIQDHTTTLDDPALPELRVIQEDHWDQHMDEDPDRPTWDDMVCTVREVPACVWVL